MNSTSSTGFAVCDLLSFLHLHHLIRRFTAFVLFMSMTLIAISCLSGEPFGSPRPAATPIQIIVDINTADPSIAEVVGAVLNDALVRDRNFVETSAGGFAVLMLELLHHVGEGKDLLDVSLTTVIGNWMQLVSDIHLDPEQPQIFWTDLANKLVRSLPGFAIPVRDDRGLPAWLYRMKYYYSPTDLAEALRNEEGVPNAIDEKLQWVVGAAQKARSLQRFSGGVYFLAVGLTTIGAFSVYAAFGPQTPDSSRLAFALGGTAAILTGIGGFVLGNKMMWGGYPHFDEFVWDYNEWYKRKHLE